MRRCSTCPYIRSRRTPSDIVRCPRHLIIVLPICSCSVQCETNFPQVKSPIYQTNTSPTTCRLQNENVIKVAQHPLHPIHCLKHHIPNLPSLRTLVNTVREGPMLNTYPGRTPPLMQNVRLTSECPCTWPMWSGSTNFHSFASCTVTHGQGKPMALFTWRQKKKKRELSSAI